PFLLHLPQVLQAVDALLHSAEVGQHAAHPAPVDEVDAGARGLGLDRLLRLLLGADEKDWPAARGDTAHEIPRVVEKPDRLLQVDDVDAVARGEDVGLHLWVPAAGLMSKVNTCLQQLFQGHLSHVSIASCSTSARFWPWIKDRSIAPGVLTQSLGLAPGVYPLQSARKPARALTPCRQGCRGARRVGHDRVRREQAAVVDPQAGLV